MKKYIVPEMEIEEVSSEDIITSSVDVLKGSLSGSSVTTDEEGNKAYEGIADIGSINRA